MEVKLVSYTTPINELKEQGIEDLNDMIAFCARVSNPSNQYNTETSDRLINYLKKNKHWSPFEMVSVCLEINTTRDISRQILRHRSFQFQEFCLSGDTEIYFEEEKIKIEELYRRWIINKKLVSNLTIKCHDLKSGNMIKTKVQEVFKTGKKPVFNVYVDNGQKSRTTKEHLFLAKDGFRSLEEIVGLKKEKEWRLTKKDKILTLNDDYVNISNVEYVGIEDTYDLEVEHTSHNYVANGIIVHNSGRYADPTKDLNFIIREARLQDNKNRQNSIEVEDEMLQEKWKEQQNKVIQVSKEAYEWAISNGIAKEQARCVLPEGCMQTRLYMNGTIRSWIHYLEVRCGEDVQKEHRLVAKACAEAISKIFPSILPSIKK